MNKRYLVIIFLFCRTRYIKTSTNECLSLDDKFIGNDNRCLDLVICNKAFKITYFDTPPYDMPKVFSIEKDIIKKCCGRCYQSPKVNRYVKGMHQNPEILNQFSENSSDFVYPVLCKATTVRKHGYYFLPVVRIPNMVYITHLEETAFQRAVNSCLALYPLVIVCFLMSFIFGFIIWLIETGFDTGAFPKVFPTGWAKAIFWSITSFFSTGLDDSPKSRVVQFLSLIWLIIAVIMVSLVTSTITAALVEPVPTPKMDGKTIGTLSNRQLNNYTILKHGGTIVTFPKEEREWIDLITQFYYHNVDGVLMDRYLLHYIVRVSVLLELDSGDFGKAFKYINMYSVWTDIEHKEDMVYGILVKSKQTYDYFRYAIDGNWINFETKFLTYLNKKSKMDNERRKHIDDLTDRPMFSVEDRYMKDGLKYLGILLVVVIVSGIVYELRRRKFIFARKKEREIVGEPLTQR